MSTRYRITRSPEDAPQGVELSLDECKSYFASQSDFNYATEYITRTSDTQMTISGDFFMWQIGDAQIPFRYYAGDLYVAVSHELVFQKMEQIAEALEAVYVEG